MHYVSAVSVSVRMPSREGLQGKALGLGWPRKVLSVDLSAPGEQYSQFPSLLEAGVEGDAPSILLWIYRRNMGVGPKIGADLCAYNKVDALYVYI